MKKYIVIIRYDDKSNGLWTLKAKNDEDLIKKVVKEIYNINIQDLVEVFEYSIVKFYKSPNVIFGNWLGADGFIGYMKELI